MRPRSIRVGSAGFPSPIFRRCIGSGVSGTSAANRGSNGLDRTRESTMARVGVGGGGYASLANVTCFTGLEGLCYGSGGLGRLGLRGGGRLGRLGYSCGRLAALSIDGGTGLDALRYSGGNVRRLGLNSVASLRRLFYPRGGLARLSIDGGQCLRRLRYECGGLEELIVNGGCDLAVLCLLNGRLASLSLCRGSRV